MKKLFSLATVALALAASGCGQETQAQKERQAGLEHCPSFTAGVNGECESPQAAKRARERERIKKESSEVEAVIKHRAAEEAANALEGATR